MTQITEKSWVPISLVGAMALPLIGFCAWLTTIYVQGNANAESIVQVRKRQEDGYKELLVKISEMQQSLWEIKGELKKARK